MSAIKSKMIRVAFRVALLGLSVATQAQTLGQPVTRTVAFEYDAYGTLVKQTVEPDDATYTVTTVSVPHPNYGVVTSRTTSWKDPLTGGAKARTEDTGYDTRYRYAERSTNAKQQISTSTHDPVTGQVLTATDPDLLVSRWEYDGWGRKTREVRPDGTATSMAYRQCVDSCLNGALTVAITQHWGGPGQASQTAVPSETFTDALGRQVLTRSWGFDGTPVLGEKVYDELGRVLRISRPHFAGAPAVWTWYDTRDPLGRVTQFRSPDKTGSSYDTSSYAYHGLSRTSTNARNQTRTELRNALGKVSAVTDSYNATTGYVYEAFGALARTTDPKGNQITIGYDRMGRKTSLSDPSLGRWSYVVDPVGQTRQQVDAKQQSTTFEFDDLGRMTRRLEPDLDSRWDYDTAAHGTGELAEAYTWAGGTKDYRRVHSYDAVGRPSSTVTSLDWDYASTVGYDAFGRPLTTAHQRAARGAGATGVTNAFVQHYNAQGFVDRIDRNDGSSSTVWQAQAIDAEGHTTQEQLGNGLVTRRGYNLYTGRLESIRSGPGVSDASVQNDSYDYDALGNLTSRSQLVANGGAVLAESFGYDDLNRLNASTVNGVTRGATYDAIGNLTSKTGVGIYRYPPSGAGSTGPSAVSAVAGTVAGLTNPVFSYDAIGNQASGLARSYAWTSYNMASSIDKLDGATAVQRTAFIYNPEHERTRQVVSSMSGGAPGAASRTIWYGGGIEKEIDAAANTTTIRTTMPSGLGFIEEEFSGTNIAATASGTRNLRYFLTDHLGSTLVIVDQGQVVLQRMSYDAWGRRRNADGTDDTGPLWGSLKNTEDHSGYTGHETLDQLGLVNMNARFYDPILGRHTSADPTVPDPANAQAFNRYSYVLNNALVFTDPTGLSPSTNGFADHGGGMWDTTFVNESPSPAAAGAGQLSGVPSGSEQSCTPANTSKDSIGPSQPSRSELLRVAATGNGIATAAVGVAESVSRALAAFNVTTIDDIPYDYMTGRFLSPGAAQDARVETVIFGAMSAVVPGAGTEMGEFKQSVRVGKEVVDAAKEVKVTAEQLKNIGRFEKKLPANAKESLSVKPLPNEGVAIQATSPGRVPGSSAVYEKQIDAAGKTIQATKTTYDPAGNIVHVKDKLNGGVFP